MAGCVGYEVGCVGSSVVFVLELCGETAKSRACPGGGLCSWLAVGGCGVGIALSQRDYFFWVGGGDGQSWKCRGGGGWEESSPGGVGSRGRGRAPS